MTMDITELKGSLQADAPPSTLSVYLKALWYDAKGNWEQAHNLVQDIETGKAAWIHAYLHRKEGDMANADYWYRKAGKNRADITLMQEWEKIVNAFL